MHGDLRSRILATQRQKRIDTLRLLLKRADSMNDAIIGMRRDANDLDELGRSLTKDLQGLRREAYDLLRQLQGSDQTPLFNSILPPM